MGSRMMLCFRGIALGLKPDQTHSSSPVFGSIHNGTVLVLYFVGELYCDKKSLLVISYIKKKLKSRFLIDIEIN
jgi:hypothetical protein